MSFSLSRVEFMPKVLEPNVLYVSEKYGTAAHLCACGCGEKIRTPLGPTEWSVKATPRGPTILPSIGSWQLPCRSHYLIIEGEVRWSDQWSEGQIALGRRLEEIRRQEYFEKKGAARPSIWSWLTRLFRR